LRMPLDCDVSRVMCFPEFPNSVLCLGCGRRSLRRRDPSRRDGRRHPSHCRCYTHPRSLRFLSFLEAGDASSSTSRSAASLLPQGRWRPVFFLEAAAPLPSSTCQSRARLQHPSAGESPHAPPCFTPPTLRAMLPLTYLLLRRAVRGVWWTGHPWHMKWEERVGGHELTAAGSDWRSSRGEAMPNRTPCPSKQE
jgi:hypothetical protein